MNNDSISGFLTQRKVIVVEISADDLVGGLANGVGDLGVEAVFLRKDVNLLFETLQWKWKFL